MGRVLLEDEQSFKREDFKEGESNKKGVSDSSAPYVISVRQISSFEFQEL